MDFVGIPKGLDAQVGRSAPRRSCQQTLERPGATSQVVLGSLGECRGGGEFHGGPWGPMVGERILTLDSTGLFEFHGFGRVLEIYWKITSMILFRSQEVMVCS